MNLSVGIVGLPNAGKSTLFNALLKKQVADVANYPFCTIEPNIGVVEVPDERLPVLAKIVNTGKIVPAVIEFYDIAGLVKGANKGEGLGNKFLTHIREVSAIIHVIRMFEDSNITHVANIVDPLLDIETIRTELALADLQTLEKQSSPRMNATKEQLAQWPVVERAKELINQAKYELDRELSHDDKELLRPLNLLSLKPVLYLFNISEKQLENKVDTDRNIVKYLTDLKIDSPFLYFCAKLENDVLALSNSEQIEYLKQFGLEEIGLNRLIKKAYQLLGLISFLTAGEKEVRAWTVKKGTLAPQAAGVIHTDFEKNFIKAEVAYFEDFVKFGGWSRSRELGKVRLEGKQYEIKEGDVVDFKIGN